jgi:hypothetical protein
MEKPRTSLFRTTFEPTVSVPIPAGETLTFHAASAHPELAVVLGAIKSGHWLPMVEAYRRSGQRADKRKLPCFTPAGTFPIRIHAFMQASSGIVCLDYDCESSLFATCIRDKSAMLPYVFGAFLSPSQTGCKVLVRVGKIGSYAERYARAAEAIDDATGAQHDKAAEGESQLCYVSADPDCHINEAATVLTAPFRSAPAGAPLTGAGAGAVAFTSRRLGPYSPGNRAVFLYSLACNCNRRGFTEDDAVAVVSAVYETDSGDIPPTEPARVVRNAYKRGAAEHGAYARRDGREPAV